MGLSLAGPGRRAVLARAGAVGAAPAAAPGPTPCHWSHSSDAPSRPREEQGLVVAQRSQGLGYRAWGRASASPPDADPTPAGHGAGVQGLPGPSSGAPWHTPAAITGCGRQGKCDRGGRQGRLQRGDTGLWPGGRPSGLVHGCRSHTWTEKPAAHTRAPPWASSAHERALSTSAAPRCAPGPASPGPREALEESGV